MRFSHCSEITVIDIVEPFFSAVNQNIMNKEIDKTINRNTKSDADHHIILINETKPFIMMSIILGFSRAISEVGAVMLVGGNIKGDTRVMTTYIALSNSMGDYSTSIAMGIILLTIAFIIHTLLARFRGDLYD